MPTQIAAPFAPLPLPTCPIITVASGKGGVGKSSLAVNLAVAIANLGVEPTLLDADMGVANADVLCGLNPARRLDRALAHRDDPSLEHLVIPAPGGFNLIPGSAGLARYAELPAPERLRLLRSVRQLAALSPLLILDAPAGVGPLVTALGHAADVTVLVTTPEPTAMADAYALLKCLQQSETGRPAAVHLVVNQVTSEAEAGNVHLRLATVARRFLDRDLPLLGFVPVDDAVRSAVRARVPLMLHAPTSPAAESIQRLAARLGPALGLMGCDAALSAPTSPAALWAPEPAPPPPTEARAAVREPRVPSCAKKPHPRCDHGASPGVALDRGPGLLGRLRQFWRAKDA